MNETAFLSALHENPADEVTWLALADWLDESGQEPRAELVRTVRRLRAMPVMKRTKPRRALESRLAELLRAGVRPVAPEITNSLGMRFALVPPGRFRMGSPTAEARRGNEPMRSVQITRPFYLGVHAVTQGQYHAITGERPSFFSRGGTVDDRLENVPDDELARFPVDQVSWDEAREFLQQLGELPAEKPHRRVYRLPSEAEWEYACRAGWCVTSAYILGDELTPADANFGDQGGRPRPVGSYVPNAFGLYDMHGNMWEWCADWFAPYEAGPAVDPRGPTTGGNRVNRGGCWHNIAAYCRAADRNESDPETNSAGLGLRAVLAVS